MPSCHEQSLGQALASHSCPPLAAGLIDTAMASSMTPKLPGAVVAGNYQHLKDNRPTKQTAEEVETWMVSIPSESIGLLLHTSLVPMNSSRRL